MKKTYIKPLVEVAKIMPEQIFASSLTNPAAIDFEMHEEEMGGGSALTRERGGFDYSWD